jgi:transposase
MVCFRMRNQTHFREFAPDQLMLLPPDLRDWLAEDDLVYFIMDVVAQLDLGAIYRDYDSHKGGQPGYHPQMMVGLLLYAYCVGMPSSRKIEKATYHSVPFRVLATDQHPDHDTIAAFRQRHLSALSGLFVQVLRLCQKAGLVKLGHVALDGTKFSANASKHKAMSYGRMEKKAAELETEIADLLAQAEARDAEEDARYGAGRGGDELPDELRFKHSRLAKIREAKRALEAETRREAEAAQPAYEAKKKAWDERENRRGGQPPTPPSSTPDAKKQRNFTDPDSRIMPVGRGASFVQAYNAQAAVDAEAQVIVASSVTRDTNDKKQIVAMVEKIKETTDGSTPERLSADSGYFSAANLTTLESETIDSFIPPEIRKTSPPPLALRGPIPHDATPAQRMTRKLRTKRGRATYKQRKAIVEPVFGQIKEARGLRRFSFRGFEKVRGEWDLICTTHNLLKLFRSNAQCAGA